MSRYVQYEEYEWKDDGLCRETDPDAFFPERGQNPELALKICERCPVTSECLEAALENDERFGVWGGTTETYRAHLRRQRAGDARHAAA